MLGYAPISDQPISSVPSAGTPTGYTLTAQAGAYTYSGQTAILTRSRLLTASAGAYVYSGQNAILQRSRLITALAGAYGYAGQDATITKATPGAYTLTALAGSYSYSGQAATITKAGGDAWGGAKFQYPNWQPYLMARRDWEKKVPAKVERVIERIARKEDDEAQAVRLLEAELAGAEDAARYTRMLIAMLQTQTRSLQALRQRQLLEIAQAEARQRAEEDDEDAILLMM